MAHRAIATIIIKYMRLHPERAQRTLNDEKKKTIESWASQAVGTPQTRRLIGCAASTMYVMYVRTYSVCRILRMYPINGVAALSNLAHYSSLATMSIRNFSIKNNRKCYAPQRAYE